MKSTNKYFSVNPHSTHVDRVKNKVKSNHA